MPLAALRLHPYRLPLRHSWRTASGALEAREGWLLRLEEDGADTAYGYGDCAPLPSIGTETPAQAQAALAAWQGQVPGREAEELLESLNHESTFATPAARAALECALLDLIARRHQRPLTACLRGCDCRAAVRVNGSLGALDSLTEPALEAALVAGFTVLKLKIGLQPASQEIGKLQALAKRLPTGVTLRLDANRAWAQNTAGEIIAALAGLPVESLEEPLQDPSPGAWAALQERAAFPLAVDESLHDLPPESLFDGSIRRLVLKLPRLGGFLPAVTLAQRFAAGGGDCVVTTALESACGVLAAAHLAATLGGDLAHGLATSDWLAADLGQAPPIASGRLILPAGPGLGFTPSPTTFFSEARARLG